MLAKTWLENARDVVDRIEGTQLNDIRRAAEIMVDSIAVERWVHTFGCGHATLPAEEMYPRIGGFVGFHPMIELPLTHFTHITGEMGIHQFLFLERAEGFGREVMKSYNFDPRDTMWIFSHSGLNPVNIDVAMEAKARGYTSNPTTPTCGRKAEIAFQIRMKSRRLKSQFTIYQSIQRTTDAVTNPTSTGPPQPKIPSMNGLTICVSQRFPFSSEKR